MVIEDAVGLEALPLAVLLLDPHGGVRQANGPARTLLSLPDGEGTSPISLPELAQLQDRRGLERFFSAAKEDTDAPQEISFISASQQPLLLRLAKMESCDEPTWLGVLMDHGPVHEMQALILELRERNQRSHRMEVLGRMTSGLAHDFNNLLTLVVGYSRLLKAKVSEEDPLYQPLSQIQTAGERATRLIDQLLTFSNGQQIGDTPLSVNNLLIDMEELLHRVLGDDFCLTYHLGTDVARTKIDSATLQQALINLLLGSREAAARGTAIELITGNVSLDAARATDMGLAPGPYVMISLEDSTTEPAGALSSERFGLTMTRELLAPSSGSAQINRRGESSAVELYLPALEADCKQVLEDTRKTVLVVDDQPELRRFATMVLAELDAEILSASSPEIAIEKARTCGRTLDLLVTDVVMPGLDGPCLYERIKEWHPNVKLLLISGHDRHSLYRDRGIDPSIPILEKPFCPDTLRVTARSFLAPAIDLASQALTLREES